MQIPDACRPRAPAPDSLGWRPPARSYPYRIGLPTISRDLRLGVERPPAERGVERRVFADIGQWLGILYECSARPNPNPAIDFVLGGVDELLRLRHYPKCDDVLQKVDLCRLSVEAMLALLMETFRAKAVLPTREAFYRRVESRLREIAPVDADDLLTGLR